MAPTYRFDTPRVALVTGASKGLGTAIALRLAAEGHKLALFGRDQAGLNEVAVATAAAAGAPSLAVACDITDAAAITAALARVEAELGVVQILVQNAGIAASAPFGLTSDEEWARVMDVNVTSAFRLARAVAPTMVKSGWGRIVGVASIAALTGSAYTGAYTASKHAFLGLTRALAAEYAAKNVTSNAVCPGYCDTEMTARSIATVVQKTGRSEADARKFFADLSPQKKLIPPDHVAHVVAMLCAEAAGSVNGQAIAIDGGQVMT